MKMQRAKIPSEVMAMVENSRARLPIWGPKPECSIRFQKIGNLMELVIVSPTGHDLWAITLEATS